MNKNLHPAVYGSTVLQTMYCKSCECSTFVIDNIKSCCDERVEEKLKQQNEYMITPSQIRKGPSKRKKDELYKLQEGKCLYCDKKIGTIYEHKGKVLFTKEAFDHYVPFSFSFNNHKTNFVLACHICNGIKSNKMFNTIEEVKSYVEYRRKKKGYTYYEDANMPVV